MRTIFPATMTRPLSAFSCPQISLTSMLFPAPLLPTSSTCSPCPMEKLV